MKARAPRDSVQGILHDLKMKTAIFSRCYVEYGTYLDELESDKIRLNVAKSQGQDTKQLEGVMKETADMLPITQQNAKKYYAGYVDFWKQRKETLEEGLEKAPAPDRAKWQRELSSEAQKLEKTIKRKHNPLTQEETASVEDIYRDIKSLAHNAKLPRTDPGDAKATATTDAATTDAAAKSTDATNATGTDAAAKSTDATNADEVDTKARNAAATDAAAAPVTESPEVPAAPRTSTSKEPVENEDRAAVIATNVTQPGPSTFDEDAVADLNPPPPANTNLPPTSTQQTTSAEGTKIEKEA